MASIPRDSQGLTDRYAEEDGLLLMTQGEEDENEDYQEDDFLPDPDEEFDTPEPIDDSEW